MTNEIKNDDVCNSDLFNLVFQAAFDAISIITKQDYKSKNSVPSHFRWVEVTYDNNGLPLFDDLWFFKNKQDFSSYVSFGLSGIISPEQIRSYVELGNYGLSDLEYQKTLFPDSEKLDTDTLQFVNYNLANSIVEKYMYVYHDQEFTRDLCKMLYLPLERKIYKRDLDIEIIIPIALLDFECDEFQISDNAWINRMSNEIQLGRAQSIFSADGIDKGPVEGCTHALVLKNWYFNNENYMSKANVIGSKQVMDSIERFFASIRIVRNVETGYSQIIQLGINWAQSYKVNLPEMSSEFVRAYPPSLQKKYLSNITRPLITKSELNEISKIYSFLMNDHHSSVSVATNRINSCYLRGSDEDSIIDATIAMEALFGDSGDQEMTHKLALRMAALSKLDPTSEKSAIDIFNDTKQIYKFRSKVVHGRRGKEIESSRFINQNSTKIYTIEVALSNLRQAIRILAENPQFLDPHLIDKNLLLQI